MPAYLTQPSNLTLNLPPALYCTGHVAQDADEGGCEGGISYASDVADEEVLVLLLWKEGVGLGLLVRMLLPCVSTNACGAWS